LSAEELKAIGEASALPPEYPAWMIGLFSAPRAKQLVEAK
jgi:hypothetical protein